MKIIITEKQVNNLLNKKNKCVKCKHTWKFDVTDDDPFFCHMCGWDNLKNKYKDDDLLIFWKEFICT